jgi:hypothetical protein
MTRYPSTPGYVSTSRTSRAAAKSVKGSAGSMRQWVLSYIARCRKNGATCEEIEARLNMLHQTASARLRELAIEDRIRVIGYRETSTGRKARVYVVNARKAA